MLEGHLPDIKGGELGSVGRASPRHDEDDIKYPHRFDRPQNEGNEKPGRISGLGVWAEYE